MKIQLLMILTLAVPSLAQTTVKDALVKHWKTSGEFTIAVANAMPPDGYAFRPNPEEMSYGQLMAHIAGVNLNACANASGLSKPALPPKIAEWTKDTQKVEVDKDTAVAFLRDRGVTVRDLPPELSPGIDYSALAIDPEGHAIQLYYYMQQVGPNRSSADGANRAVGAENISSWPQTVAARPDTFMGEPYLGPWG